MTQSRYFSAFLLSSLTFLLLYFAFLSLATIEKKLKPAPPKVIKIALISPPKEIVKPTPVVKPIPTVMPIPLVPPVMLKKIEKKKPKKIVVKAKPKKVIKKKVIKKKVIKKKVIKKKVIKKKIVRKKVIKKKVIKKVRPRKVIKKVVKKKIIKKRVVKKPVETYIPITPYIAPPVYVSPPVYVAPPVVYVAPPVYVPPKPRIEPIIKPTIVAPKINANNGQAKKAFLRNVRSNIIANKKYPKIAKRRHIEGSVKVRFDITRHGHVTNIRFINGKRIFQKSIRKTLERTFPIGIPNEVRNELPILNISVTLHFNIR